MNPGLLALQGTPLNIHLTVKWGEVDTPTTAAPLPTLTRVCTVAIGSVARSTAASPWARTGQLREEKKGKELSMDLGWRK